MCAPECDPAPGPGGPGADLRCNTPPPPPPPPAAPGSQKLKNTPTQMCPLDTYEQLICQFSFEVFPPGNQGGVFFQNESERARTGPPDSRPKMKSATFRWRHFAHLVYLLYIRCIWGTTGVPMHAQAARRPFRPRSGAHSVVAAPRALMLLLWSITGQCEPIVPGCTAPRHKMSPVNGGRPVAGRKRGASVTQAIALRSL